MTQPMEDAISAIAAVVAGVSGIKSAPAYPHEQMTESPFAVIYPLSGVLDIGPIGTRKSLDNINIDVLTVRRDIALDLATLLPLYDLVPAALSTELTTSGDVFSGTISTFKEILREFIPGIDYAGVQMIGYRFTMVDVKILVNL